MRLPSPALVISLIALFVALGGTSYAVTQLPKNSVGTKQLKKSAVTSAKIKDGTIGTADLASAARVELKGQKGDTGATGAAGPQGIPGPTASAYAVNPMSDTTSLTTASYQTLLDTRAASQSGPLVLTVRSRVVVQASLHFFKGTNAYNKVADFMCRVMYGAAGQALATTGVESRATLPNVATTTPGAGEADPAMTTMLPVAAVLTLDPGQYDFTVECISTTTNTRPTSVANAAEQGGTLTVIATAA